MSARAKKFLDDSGATLVESLVSLVLLTGIIMPLIWLFMGSTYTVKLSESTEIERIMYQKLIQNDLPKDSIRINNHVYRVIMQDYTDYREIVLRSNDGSVIYRKTVVY